MPKKIQVCGGCGVETKAGYTASMMYCYAQDKMVPVITKMDWGNHG